jgi:ribonucleoside-diphosphate reductase alpha chain
MLKEPISSIIWDLKYRYRQNGQVIDQTLEDTWHRVAKAIAAAEKPSERAHWEQAFYRVLEHFQFLPGGRILAGAGTVHQVTLLNCFVMSIPEDSLEGIFTAIKEGALTLQAGGGVGYDFSILTATYQGLFPHYLAWMHDISWIRIRTSQGYSQKSWMMAE